METRNASFWVSPAGIMVALLLVVVVVLVGFLAYAPIARAWWVGRLTHDNEKIADEARERIRAMGGHAAGALSELLDSADQQKRREAALLLGELKYYDLTLPFWIERLTSGNAEYAADARDYLAGMGERAITDIRLLLESGDLRRRFAAYAVCIKMGRRDLAPMTLRMDYALDGAGFPRGSVAFRGLADGEKYGDLVVVAATGLANSVMNIPEDKSESCIGAARKEGFDAIMRGQVIFFDNIGQIETYGGILPPPVAEPEDEAGRAVWRRVKEGVLSTGGSKIKGDRFPDVLDFIRTSLGVNVVVDPAAVDGRPVTIDVDMMLGDVFLDMLTLHRGLAWRIMGPAVVIFDPPGRKDRFTVSKGEFKNYPRIARKLDAKHPFEFESVSFREALGNIEKTADLTVVRMPDVDLTKKVNLKIEKVSVRHALDYLVKVVAGYYWFVSDGAIVVSSEKPPSDKIVPGRDFSALAGKFPEIAGHLASRTVTDDFDGQDLTNVAKVLQDRTGIHVFLDPGLYMEPPPVSVRVNERPLKDVLNRISRYVGCSWDVRYGGIYMAPEEKLRGLPRSIPLPPGDDLPGGIEAKLNGKIFLNLDKTPLAEVVLRLQKDENVPIRIGKSAKWRGQENAIISCNLADLELRYALEAVLLPVGLSWKLEKGEIVIIPQ